MLQYANEMEIQQWLKSKDNMDLYQVLLPLISKDKQKRLYTIFFDQNRSWIYYNMQMRLKFNIVG